MNTLSYSNAKPTMSNFAQLIEKAAVLSPAIQEEIILQWFDDIENDTATLQWQKTLEQPQPKLEFVALIG